MSKCVLCGGNEFEEFAGRRNASCKKCKSLERTRVIGLLLKSMDILQDNMNILHFAPEKCVHDMLESYNPSEYIKADIREKVEGIDVTYFDIPEQIHTLPDQHFDLIIHNHILEHLRCSDVYILYHIHRALKPKGKHIFSVPIWPGMHYKADFNESDPNKLLASFKQKDHVALYGAKDFEKGLGACLNIKATYNLVDYISESDLKANNIEERFWKGLNGSSVFIKNKDDWAYNL